MYGLEGILFVTGTKFKLLQRIKKGSLIFNLINFIYHIVAYNRYILFPINSAYKCNCEPQFNKKYRLVLFAICITGSILISSLFGYAISRNCHKPLYDSVFYTLLAVGSGWIMQIVLAVSLLKGEKLYDYLCHLGVIMFTGVLILLPGLTTVFLPTSTFLCAMLFFVTGSCATMTTMHGKRIKTLGLKKAWTYSWFLFLQLSVISVSCYLLKIEQWTF